MRKIEKKVAWSLEENKNTSTDKKQDKKWVHANLKVHNQIISEKICFSQIFDDWRMLLFQVDIIKTVTLPLIKKFVVDDEGLDLKVSLASINEFYYYYYYYYYYY